MFVGDISSKSYVFVLLAVPLSLIVAIVIIVSKSDDEKQFLRAEWSADYEESYHKVIKHLYGRNSSYFTFNRSLETEEYEFPEQWFVKDEFKPMRWSENQTLYWNIETLRRTDPSDICQYRIGAPDLHLRHTYFQNGSQVKHLYYGCSIFSRCEGLECNPRTMWKVVVVIAICIALLIFLMAFFTYKMIKSGKEMLEMEPRLHRNGELVLVHKDTDKTDYYY